MKSNRTKQLEKQLAESRQQDLLRAKLTAELLANYTDEELKLIGLIVHQRFHGPDLDD